MSLDLARIAALHNRLQITITLLLLALAAWAVVAALRNGAGEAYGAGLRIAQLLILAQCVLGLLVLLGSGFRHGLALHIVYGITMAATLPAIRRYNRGYPPRRQAWILAATCLVLAGMAIRAVATVAA
jgi:hypothetical protein